MDNSKENKKVVTTTISKAYQITVPSAVRKMLGLKPGDVVDFKMLGDRVTLSKAMSHEDKVKQAFADLDRWRESLPSKTKKLIEKHAGWTVNQLHEHYDNLPETKNYLKEKYGV